MKTGRDKKSELKIIKREGAYIKNKFAWWQIFGLIIDFIGAAVLVVCFATDINDEVLLPVALFCVLVANVMQSVMNIRHNKNKRL